MGKTGTSPGLTRRRLPQGAGALGAAALAPGAYLTGEAAARQIAYRLLEGG